MFKQHLSQNSGSSVTCIRTPSIKQLLLYSFSHRLCYDVVKNGNNRINYFEVVTGISPFWDTLSSKTDFYQMYTIVYMGFLYVCSTIQLVPSNWHNALYM